MNHVLFVLAQVAVQLRELARDARVLLDLALGLRGLGRLLLGPPLGFLLRRGLGAAPLGEQPVGENRRGLRDNEPYSLIQRR